ncbi:hypothetical protein ACHAQJ_007378 [Trichoderma viride]
MPSKEEREDAVEETNYPTGAYNQVENTIEEENPLMLKEELYPQPDNAQEAPKLPTGSEEPEQSTKETQVAQQSGTAGTERRRSAQTAKVKLNYSNTPAKKKRAPTVKRNKGIHSILKGFTNLTGDEFVPDQFKEEQRDKRSLQPVFAMLHAAFNQKSAHKLNAAPSKPRVTWEDLAKPPRN